MTFMQSLRRILGIAPPALATPGLIQTDSLASSQHIEQSSNDNAAPCITAIPDDVSLTIIEQGFYGLLLQLPNPALVPSGLPSALRSKLHKASYRDSVVPRLPAIIPRLMRSLRDPDAAIKDYIALVKKDPTLVAAVLKKANSAHYNPSGKSQENVDLAVATLGVDGLRRVLSVAVMKPMLLRSNSESDAFAQALWQHSLRVASACELLAPRFSMEPYHGYLLGLSHGIGDITVTSEMAKLKATQPLKGASLYGAIQAMGASLSALIVDDWEMPERIIEALEDRAHQKASEVQTGSLLNLAVYLSQFSFLLEHDHTQYQDAGEVLSRDWKLPAGFFSQLLEQDA